jgi:hypothetical protein
MNPSDENIKAKRQEREATETQADKEARELKNSDLKKIAHQTTTFKLPQTHSDLVKGRADRKKTSVSFVLKEALETLVLDANGKYRTEPKKPREEWYSSESLSKSKFQVSTIEDGSVVTKQPLVRVLGDIKRKRIPFDDSMPKQVGHTELTTIRANLPVLLLKEVYALADHFQMSVQDVVTQAVERFIHSTTIKEMPNVTSGLVQFHAERQQRLDESTERKLANRQARKGVNDE